MLRKEFYFRIMTEESAFDFAVEEGLLKTERRPCVIDGCGGTMNLEKGKTRHSVNLRMRCNKRACRKCESIFKNTIFHNTHFSVSECLEYIYAYCEGRKISHVASDLNVQRKYLALFFKKIEDIIVFWYTRTQSNQKIGSLHHFVEVDETHLFRRKNHQGRVLRGQGYWVIGAIDRLTKKIKIESILRRNRMNIESFMLRNVENSSTIISDCWRGYNGLSDLNYTHYTVNHSINFVDPENQLIHTNTIERLWRSLKSNISKNTRLIVLKDKLILFEIKYNFHLQKTSDQFYFELH
ncbi:hypothetical protein DMUE_0489 [Dictyocoela muelleri]|nr:hypothetical protein DMUE_0489 [Dictyocoela muelleri]